MLLAAWIAGGLVMLTIPATKRDIYLLPLLPALALACATAFRNGFPKWCRIIYAAWTGVCVLLPAAAALSPFLAPLVPGRPEWAQALGPFSWRHALCAAAFAAAAVSAARNGAPTVRGALTATALAFLGLLSALIPAADAALNLDRDFRAFAAAIPAERRDRVVLWEPFETTKSLFYYYADLKMPEIWGGESLDAVLRREDPRFDSVVAVPTALPADAPPRRALAALEPSSDSRRRHLAWIEGGAAPDAAGK